MPAPAPLTTAHLIIAFAGATTPAFRDALQGLRLPQLDALLAWLTPMASDTQDAHTLSPPHERALAQTRGIGAPDGCIPWAAWAAREAGLPGASEGTGWGLLTLCHWQVGMDQAVLADPAALRVNAEESRALYEAARPFFAEDGMALHLAPQTNPTRPTAQWLAQGDIFKGLATAAIDRAVGQPIAHWLAPGTLPAPLMRLHNEMQMLFYTHPVNDARSAQGLLPINAFWLSGTGALTATTPIPTFPASVTSTLDTSLRDAALREDAGAWAQAWQALDTGLLADILAATRQCGLPLRLTLCGERTARHFESPASRGLFATLRRRLQAPAARALLESL